MQVCIAEMRGKPVTLELRGDGVYLDGEPEPIKNLTEKELREFQDELDALPKSDDPGYAALVNAMRASFIARLLGKAVGDDCISKLTHILDYVHYDVLQYLGETGEEAS